MATLLQLDPLVFPLDIRAMRITDILFIDEGELSEAFVQSSGPGGQNVNKVATAVQLRFRVGTNGGLTDAQKDRLRKIAGRRLTKEDEIVIEAKTHRTQSANRDEARRRLAGLIRASLSRPKKRLATKPSRGSIERRIKAKKQRSQLKANRGNVVRED